MKRSYPRWCRTHLLEVPSSLLDRLRGAGVAGGPVPVEGARMETLARTSRADPAQRVGDCGDEW